MRSDHAALCAMVPEQMRTTAAVYTRGRLCGLLAKGQGRRSPRCKTIKRVKSCASHVAARQHRSARAGVAASEKAASRRLADDPDPGAAASAEYLSRRFDAMDNGERPDRTGSLARVDARMVASTRQMPGI